MVYGIRREKSQGEGLLTVVLEPKYIVFVYFVIYFFILKEN